MHFNESRLSLGLSRPGVEISNSRHSLGGSSGKGSIQTGILQSRISLEAGHSRVPLEAGHSRVPLEAGHSRTSLEVGHSRASLEAARSRVPMETGGGRMPHEAGMKLVARPSIGNFYH